MKASTLFDTEAQEAIRRAAAEAEKATGGEVVPYVVDRSDTYPGTHWALAAAGAVLAATAAAWLHGRLEVWGDVVLWGALPALAGAVAGYALAWVPALRRWLTPADRMEERVELRAAAAFLEQEVFATRDRTGVLLFVSLFEHRVVVLADAGIHAKLEAGVWETVAADLAAGIKRGEPVAAMVEAIGACGRLLAEGGVERRPDDVDELSNELRIGDA